MLQFWTHWKGRGKLSSITHHSLLPDCGSRGSVASCTRSGLPFYDVCALDLVYLTPLLPCVPSMMSMVTYDNTPKGNAVSRKLLLSQQQDGSEKWADHMVLEALELL